MRDLIYILGRKFAAAAVVAAAFMCTGCVTDDTTGPDGLGSEYSVTITTRAEDNNGHDAKAPGEDAYNENKIDRVTLFFYPISDNPTEEDDDVPAIYSETIENINKSHTVNLSIKADLREALFGQIDGSARVYAVVNLPKSDKAGETKNAPTIAENATVNQIRATIVETDFRIKDGTLPEFVMSGEGRIDFTEDMKKAEGRIRVARTASKIRIALQVVESVTEADPTEPSEGKKEWKPIVDKARVYITNGVSKAHVGGKPFERSELSEDDYYKISPMSDSSPHAPRNEGDYANDSGTDFELRARRVSMTSGIEEYPYWHDVPLYSYPHKWETSVFEDRQTYLVIQMPWEPVELGDGEVVIKTFYYQVPINLRGGKASDIDGNEWEIEENTLESNMYYLIKLKIGMLGSFNPEDPLKVEADYYVVPWQEETLDAELTDNRYLVVDQTNWVINNESKLDIPFHTSHKTVVARVNMSFYNYNAGKDAFEKEDPSGSSSHYVGKPLKRTVYWENDLLSTHTETNKIFNKTTEQNNEPMWRVTIPDGDNFIIQYEHDMKRWTEMNSSGNPVFPYDNLGDPLSYAGPTDYLQKTDMSNWSKIETEITIIHEDRIHLIDQTRFMQTVYITQYPAQYIDAEYNDNPLRDDRSGSSVFINGNTNVNVDDLYEWEAVAAFTASLNQNPNMYVVTVSQLDTEYSDFVIGDPRTLEPNNLLNNNSFGQEQGVDDDDDKSTGSNGTWGTVPGVAYYMRVDESYDYGNTSWYFYSGGQNRAYYRPAYTSYTCGYKPPVSVKDVNGEERSLENYHPTDESGYKANYIAPKLRIASSYGAARSLLPRTAARRRCATYQEAGRPAGRWRLPTQAEMQYICHLSAQGKLPRLFSGYPNWIKDDGVYRTFDATYNYEEWVGGTFTGRWVSRTRTVNIRQRTYPYYWCAQGPAKLNGVYGSEITDEAVFGFNIIDSRLGGITNDDSGNFGKVEVMDITNNYFGTRNPLDAYNNRSSNYEMGYKAEQTAVRCVYDEWYWVDEDGNPDLCEDSSKFTWGDKYKQSPQD